MCVGITKYHFKCISLENYKHMDGILAAVFVWNNFL